MPKFIFTSVNNTTRFDPAIAANGVEGVCTAGIQTCVAVIVYGKNSQRISLTHCNAFTDPAALMKEIEWVLETSEDKSAFTVTQVINSASASEANISATAQGIQNIPNVQRKISTFIVTKIKISNLSRTIDSTTGYAFVDKQGQVTIWNTPANEMVYASDVLLRNAIEQVNGIYSNNILQPTPEHDGRTFLRPAQIDKGPLIVLNLLQMSIEQSRRSTSFDDIVQCLEHVDKTLRNLGGRKGAHFDRICLTPHTKDVIINALKTILDAPAAISKVDDLRSFDVSLLRLPRNAIRR